MSYFYDGLELKSFQHVTIIVYHSYMYPPNISYLNHGLVRSLLLPLGSRVSFIYYFSEVPFFHALEAPTR